RGGIGLLAASPSLPRVRWIGNDKVASRVLGGYLDALPPGRCCAAPAPCLSFVRGSAVSGSLIDTHQNPLRLSSALSWLRSGSNRKTERSPASSQRCSSARGCRSHEPSGGWGARAPLGSSDLPRLEQTAHAPCSLDRVNCCTSLPHEMVSLAVGARRPGGFRFRGGFHDPPSVPRRCAPPAPLHPPFLLSRTRRGPLRLPGPTPPGLPNPAPMPCRQMRRGGRWFLATRSRPCWVGAAWGRLRERRCGRTWCRGSSCP